MPQPVKLSDTLIDAARETAPVANRSLAAQIEHWAALGRAIEGALTTDQSATLKRSVQEAKSSAYGASTPAELAAALADALASALRPEFGTGLRTELARSPRAVYGTHKAYPGYLVRQDPDGALTPGRLVDRQFVPAAVSSPQSPRLRPERQPRRVAAGRKHSA